MSELESCPRCGWAPAAGSPGGLCPRCLLKGVLEVSSSHNSPVPGVLDTLSMSAGPMPRVLLRDTENFNGPGPVVRLTSTEIPDRTG